MLYVGMQDCCVVVGVGGDGMVVGVELEQVDVDQYQVDIGDQFGDDGIVGDQLW